MIWQIPVGTNAITTGRSKMLSMKQKQRPVTGNSISKRKGNNTMDSGVSVNIGTLIEEVKASSDAWIFNKDGTLKDNVIVGDVIPLLQEIEDNGYEADEEDLKDFDLRAFIKGAVNYYSYNYNTNISHDLSLWYKDDSPYGILYVHLYGDAKGGFSYPVVVKFDDYNNALDGLMDLETATQIRQIDENYTADISLFSKTFKVSDKDGRYIGDFADIEKSDLLDEIKEAEENLDLDQEEKDDV